MAPIRSSAPPATRCDSSIDVRSRRFVMWQQGQVFKLKAKSIDGQPLWAYRYRLEGRSSARPQVGGFATRADALKAIEKVLARLAPGGRGGDDDAQRAGGRVPGDASGGASDDREDRKSTRLNSSHGSIS